MIKIDKGIAISGKKASPGAPAKYPFKAMDVGDSFFVPLGESTYIEKARTMRSCSKKSIGPRTISVRSVTEDGIEGLRVWRKA